MMRTPEEQYMHELIESYVAPLRNEIRELKLQLSTKPVKNNGVLPVVVSRSEQLRCDDCGGKINKLDAWCKHCGEVIG